jgi:hypothetical protein
MTVTEYFQAETLKTFHVTGLGFQTSSVSRRTFIDKCVILPLSPIYSTDMRP